jgi:hypothetical protein
MVYLAFVLDACSRRLLGWRVTCSFNLLTLPARAG